MDASLGYIRRLSTNSDILSGIDLSEAEIEQDERVSFFCISCHRYLIAAYKLRENLRQLVSKTEADSKNNLYTDWYRQAPCLADVL